MGASIITPLFTDVISFAHEGSANLLSFGLPLPKGSHSDISQLVLTQNGMQLDAVLTSVAYWNDKSIRWIHCHAIVTQSGSVTLGINGAGAVATPHTDIYKIDEKHGDELFSHPEHDLQVALHLQLSGHKTPLSLCIEQQHVTADTLSRHYAITGYLEAYSKRLQIQATITICQITDSISIKLRAHNPDAAVHQAGKWDLGDPNSLYIHDFSISFKTLNSQASIAVIDEYLPKTTQDNHFYAQGDFTLTQYGSGGRHWHSPIHWNEHRESTVNKRGYELCVADEVMHQGMRARPQLILQSGSSEGELPNIFTLELDGFWQNFPTSLTGHQDGCRWQLLAPKTELQGGESKTWTLQGRFSSAIHQAFPVTTFTFNPSYLNQCCVLPWISLAFAPSSVGVYIDQGLNGERNFFTKREKKDVFGWRHYGEIDADHEAVNAPEPNEFISHYNNQYDPLLGMTLQFLHRGNLHWLPLIRPLNQHLQDIDIYDTDKDKAEYNGGLMWHTDHYLSAQTCTHRSNSKYHEHAYEGFLGGGGPGGQHCYTTGLTLQYWLFTDLEAKQKVAQLCAWIRHFYNGSGSLLDRTFRLLSIDFKSNQLTNIGFKAPGYKYPLDRGTANFIIALIDHYELTTQPELLSEIAEIIRHTFHPNEDIAARDLKNVEQSWFYTIFLQAVVRYLLLKESLEQNDADYWYARDGLMHYGRWMLHNESYYLDSPEQLEFPNDTWCAQEIRKANLFYYCHYFANENNPAYIQKAQAYYSYIAQRLATSSETQHTRILAILMQNDGVEQKFLLNPSQSSVSPQHIEHGEPLKANVSNILKQYVVDLYRLSKHFSVKDEYRWLSIRVKHVFKTS